MEDTAQNQLQEQRPKVVNIKQPDEVSIFLTCQLNQRLGIIHRPTNAHNKTQFMTSIKLPHVLALGGRSLIFAMKCVLLGAVAG